MLNLTNKRVLLGVTGGIAAYKSAELVRRLQDQGAEVRVVMTRAATEFITPLTMQALSGHPVHLHLLDPETESVMGHIELARWADIILVAPASANFMARLAQGQGDDLLTTVCLAAQCRLAVAPAMNQAMWSNGATQANVATLIANRVLIFGPDEGIQACGEVGAGRLLDVDGIVALTAKQFPSALLAGKKVVITAGPTREAIDPVRFISNHSSGKQGYALAEAAIAAGASVILISGPTALAQPDRCQFVPVVSARDMLEASLAAAADADVFIGVAAVADYTPLVSQAQKIKKPEGLDGKHLTIELVQTTDIIATIASGSPRPFMVGFAAETQDVVAYARRKLARKKLDMVIANDVSDTTIGFNSDNNRTTVIWKDHEEAMPMASKRNVGEKIIEFIAQQLAVTGKDQKKKNDA